MRIFRKPEAVERSRDPAIHEEVTVELDDGELIQAVVTASFRTEDGKLTVHIAEL